MRTIKAELSKWETIPYYLFERLKIVKMTVLPRLIYGFNAMPIKITARYFMEI
jgi:hypothetical protein